MSATEAGSAAPSGNHDAILASLRRRVREELRRANRAAALAISYEALAGTGPPALRTLRTRMAMLHRQMETRHRTTAALHELHVARVEAWLGAGRASVILPAFTATVAAAMGAGSASVTMHGKRQATVVAAASDSVARAACDLEVALGEGPGAMALSSGAPVSAAAGALIERWPLYGPAVGELGVQSVLAVPLQRDAACLGTLCAYGREPVLRDGALAVADRIADALAYSVLSAPQDPETYEPLTLDLLFSDGDYQAAVHQAVGMTAARLGCGMDDAEALLRARAFADGQPVEELARAVLQGQVQLN